MGDGGAGVGGVRQLVRGQRGHASGREAPREEVVECRQLVGSRLLTPASTAVTEPDLGASRVENGGLSLAPGGELRLSENRAPPPTSHHPPPSQHHRPSPQRTSPPWRGLGQCAECFHRHGSIPSSRAPPGSVIIIIPILQTRTQGPRESG